MINHRVNFRIAPNNLVKQATYKYHKISQENFSNREFNHQGKA